MLNYLSVITRSWRKSETGLSRLNEMMEKNEWNFAVHPIVACFRPSTRLQAPMLSLLLDVLGNAVFLSLSSRANRYLAYRCTLVSNTECILMQGNREEKKCNYAPAHIVSLVVRRRRIWSTVRDSQPQSRTPGLLWTWAKANTRASSRS